MNRKQLIENGWEAVVMYRRPDSQNLYDLESAKNIQRAIDNNTKPTTNKLDTPAQ